MPPLETADHWQDAVLWERNGTDNYGQPIVKSPVGLKVRWESEYREVLTSDGSRITTEIVVHVSRDIALGSIMWEGKISNLPFIQSQINNLYEAVFVDTTVDLKNRFTNRGVLLQRFRDSLPKVI